MFDLDLFINKVRPLMQKKSVINENEMNTPFGIEIDKALDEALKLGQDLGFDVYKDKDGYYGYIEVGEGDLFGVLAHVDVVSEIDASKWSSAPFDVTVIDKVLYGRGIEDDKGPLVLCLLALKDLLDQGYQLTKRIRFIIGCDEESLWRCIKKYKVEQEIPIMGFSPDGMFPLVNVEKTLYQLKISANQEIDYTFSGGNAINQVAAVARTSFNPNLIDVMEQLNMPYHLDENDIVFNGIAAHVTNAEDGVNAITHLALAMKHANYHNNLIDFITNHLLSPFGEQLIKPNYDDISNYMKLNVGTADFKNNLQTITIDMRLPITLKREDIDNQLANYAYKYNLRIEEIDFTNSLYVKEDSELITKLMQAYHEVINDNKKPMVSGGATYARAFDNMVAFGPNFSKTSAHEINEHISIEDLKKAYDI
ncbi:MAG: Sapep family Mn(2+)-dependent dipeptidase, partial [Bacilli bacterium]|nr:Sapep family Mn(2+)-dependent dipeptidase [Bacilli bacterium]